MNRAAEQMNQHCSESLPGVRHLLVCARYLNVFLTVKSYCSLLREPTSTILHRGEDGGWNIDVVTLQKTPNIHQFTFMTFISYFTFQTGVYLTTRIL